MTFWNVARKENVFLRSILRASFFSYTSFFVVLKINADKVLCTELEQVFAHDYSITYSTSDFNAATQTNFSFSLLFDENGYLCSGQDYLFVQTENFDKNFSAPPPRTAFRSVSKLCALCGTGNLNCARTGILSIVGPSSKQIWIHAYCYACSPKKSDEIDDVDKFLLRLHTVKCTRCNKRYASLYCIVPRCLKIFHLPCAELHDAEYLVDKAAICCPNHLQKYCFSQRKLIGYPQDSAKYQRICSWDKISQRDIATIRSFSNHYQPFNPHWFKRDFSSLVGVVSIDPSHWAYDDSVKRTQYEVVARTNIDTGEVIGEYIGEVVYAADQDENSCYCAKLYLPDALAAKVPALVVDGLHVGNEMRFINSVSPTTPEYLVVNVEFMTYFAGGYPRIMLEALRPIKQGESLVLNYGPEFFKKENN